jgi:hypothetical protein
VVQAVAERLLTRDVAFTTADDLLPWCIVVARNLTVDLARHAARHSAPHPLPEQAVSSTEEAVWQRLRVERTLSALRTLSARDQDLILAGLTEDRAGALTGRDRVARHRARTRLLRLVGPAALAGVLGRIVRGARTAVPVTAVAVGLAVTCDLATVVGPPSGPTPVQVMVPAQLVQAAQAESGQAPRPRPARVADSPRPGSVAGGDRHVVPVLSTPDQGHTVVVTGHDRGPSDAGLVCVEGLPVVSRTCLGPAAP